MTVASKVSSSRLVRTEPFQDLSRHRGARLFGVMKTSDPVRNAAESGPEGLAEGNSPRWFYNSENWLAWMR